MRTFRVQNATLRKEHGSNTSPRPSAYRIGPSVYACGPSAYGRTKPIWPAKTTGDDALDLPRTLKPSRSFTLYTKACENPQNPQTLRVRSFGLSVYEPRTFRVQIAGPSAYFHRTLRVLLNRKQEKHVVSREDK